MQIVEICRMFGWTYYQFLDQPKFFTDLIREKLKVDAQIANNIKNNG